MTRPKTKPRLTQWVIDYAMDQARRLKKDYPKGLTTDNLAAELHTGHNSATATMSVYGFRRVGKRFLIGDVAALLAYRQYRRMQRYLGRKKKEMEEIQ